MVGIEYEYIGELSINSAEETKKIGVALGLILPTPILLLLIGELGCGKTTFVQGLGEALGISSPITSPAFLLMKEYLGVRTLRHIDLYKVSDAKEVEKVGIVEDLRENTIVAVEWGTKIDLNLDFPKLIVEIKFGDGENDRVLVFNSCGLTQEDIIRIKDALWNH